MMIWGRNNTSVVRCPLSVALATDNGQRTTDETGQHLERRSNRWRDFATATEATSRPQRTSEPPAAFRLPAGMPRAARSAPALAIRGVWILHRFFLSGERDSSMRRFTF